MKRIAAFAVLLAVVVAAFAAGSATSQAGKKFTWASDALNCDCGKTELEWRIATAKYSASPIGINNEFDLTMLEIGERTNGLLATANIRFKKGVPDRTKAREWPDDLQAACRDVVNLAQVRLRLQKGDFPKWAVHLSLDDGSTAKPVAEIEEGKFRVRP